MKWCTLWDEHFDMLYAQNGATDAQLWCDEHRQKIRVRDGKSTLDPEGKISTKSPVFLAFSSCHNSLTVTPIHACSISKCSSRRVHHFISLHHFHLSSSCCPKCCWRRAMWGICQICFSKWHFVIFAMINVCMLWSWALHVFCYMLCHLTGVYAMYFCDICGE